ncbi:hypothetical protein KIL84_000581 [Mauremys mutica]|uniref:Uncharacterized protein n=1 Tax=Mauremys mutica TaxID=74926 RepID=A0A9D3WXF7_9SAUR|nr:hypothetical protein KIL84_000581 [Mauremys mutica]
MYKKPRHQTHNTVLVFVDRRKWYVRGILFERRLQSTYCRHAVVVSVYQSMHKIYSLILCSPLGGLISISPNNQGIVSNSPVPFSCAEQILAQEKCGLIS